MLALTLLAPFLVYSFGRVSSLSITEDTEVCLRSINCPTTEAPVCVRVKNGTHGIKPVYILALNECEVKYLKCYPALDAEVVPKETCHFGNETQSSRNVGAKGRIKRGTKKNTEDGLGIIQFTSDQFKNDDIQKLTEWSANSLEDVEEKIHFGFVVELSEGSTHVLPDIKDAIKAVIIKVTQDTSKRIKDMVLTVYVYPEIHSSLATRTDSVQEFMGVVDEMKCASNHKVGRCVQNIYQASVLALDRAVPGTHMFVFSNSQPSEDDAQFDIEVIRLAQEKAVQVTFVVIGDCGSTKTAEFQSYYHVADRTHGQVVRIEKEQLNDQFMKYINHTVMEHDRRIVLSRVFPADGSDRLRIPFHVTEKDEFIMVTVSGKDCDCVVFNNKNNTMEYNYNVSTEHVKMYRYITLDPGQYRIRLHPNTYSHTHQDLAAQVLVSVAASSVEMLFKYGFSEKDTNTLKNTEAQPAEDTSLYIVVAVREPKGLVIIRNVVLLNMDDEVIATYKLIKTSKEDVYRSKYHVTIPDMTRMKIRINGNLRDNLHKKLIERTSTRIIKPYKMEDKSTTTTRNKPTKTVTTTAARDGNGTQPTTTLTTTTGSQKRVMAKEGKDVTIVCRLPGIKRAEWSFKEDGGSRYVPIREKSPELELGSITTKDSGLYKCRYANRNKVGEHVTALTVQKQGSQKRVMAKEGKDVTIVCRLPGIKRAEWSFKEDGGSRYVPIREKSPELELGSITTKDSGLYKCRYANRNKVGQHVTALTVQKQDKFSDKTGHWRPRDECLTKCPVRDIMVCARCQHGVYRTFPSGCYMRMYQCRTPEDRLELVVHRPCVESAPFLGESPRPKSRLAFPDDDDPVLRFLDTRH